MVRFFNRIKVALHYFFGKVRHLWARTREAQYRFWHKRKGRVCIMALFTLCLCATIELVFDQINLVYVTDSTGASTVLLVQDESAEEIMQLSGLEVGEYDEYYYTAYSGNHAVLTVQRAYEVSVTADGISRVAYSNGGTVQDALAQLNITLGENDFVEPSLHTTLQEGDTVQVHRVTYGDTKVESEIPYTTTYHYTSLLHRFKSRTYVMQNGRDGVQETVYRERRVDGVVESSEQIDQYVTQEPVDEIIMAYGAGVPVSDVSAPAGITVNGTVPSSYRYVISNAICTGYYSATGRGSSRLGLYAGTVAVNPNRIPYGSILYITSADGSFVYGWAIATDTGTALMEGIIDIDLFYESYLESALNGRKYLNVYVVS